MKLNGIEIGGRSVSGFETFITLPEMSILLDCGRGSSRAMACETVLVTHGHLDHFGGVAQHAHLRDMTHMSPSTFVVPPFLEEAVHEQFWYWSKVQGGQKAAYKVVVAKPGEKVLLGNKRFVRSFDTFHRVSSQGYVVGETRKRLKPEYAGLEGRELAALRRAGQVIENEEEVLLVAFTGDTTVSVFDQDIEALKAKILITECTFLGDTPIEEAHKKGHIHLDELVARAERFSGNEALVLTHFSHRYGPKDIAEAFEKLPDALQAKTHHLMGVS